MSDETTEQHESYGMVGLSRFTCGPHGMNLFGSSIQHSSGIALTVMRAEKHRDLNREWYFGRGEIVRLILSPAQFADLITSLNVGQGVPCTLEHVEGKRAGRCPEVNQRQLFEAEFECDVRKVMDEAGTIVREVSALLNTKANITQAERKTICKKLEQLNMHIVNNLPFVQSQFNEAMDKTVTEAKAEVEEFVNAKIHSLGIEALSSEIAHALQVPANSRPFLLTERTGESE